MFFALENAVPVRRRDDGLLEKDTFDISTAVPVQSSDLTLSQKVLTNPIVSKTIDVISGGMSLEKSLEVRKNIVDSLSSIPKIILAGTEIPGVQKAAVPAEQALPEYAGFILTTLTRPITAVQSGLGSIPGDGSASKVLQGLVTGFLNPEEVKTITSNIPFQNFEQGGVEKLIPRATLEAIETFAVSNLVYGNYASKIKKAYEQYKIEGVKKELDDITTSMAKKVVDDPEQFKIKFPDEWNNADKIGMTKVHLQNILGTNPAVGDALMARQALSSKVKRTLSKFGNKGSVTLPSLGDDVNFQGIKGKITEIVGDRVTIAMGGREVVAHISQLSVPQVADVKPEVAEVKPQDFNTAEEYVASHRQMYHQTTKEGLEGIKASGFKIIRGKAGLGDELPIGINTKTSPNLIRLEGKDQLGAYISKDAKVKDFDNRESVVGYLRNKSDEYNKIIFEKKATDVSRGRELDALEKEELNLRKDTSIPDADKKSKIEELNRLQDELLEKWKKETDDAGENASKVASKILLDEGLDAIYIKEDVGGVFGNQKTDNLIVLKEGVLKTKSQLTAEWQAANKPSSASDPRNFKTAEEYVVSKIGQPLKSGEGDVSKYIKQATKDIDVSGEPISENGRLFINQKEDIDAYFKRAKELESKGLSGEELSKELKNKPVNKIEVKKVFRAVSKDEMMSILKSGKIKSDGRMNMGYEVDEGMTVYKDRDPRWYLPEEGGYIIEVNVTPESEFFYDKNDSYVKTRKSVDASNIVSINGKPFNKSKLTAEWQAAQGGTPPPPEKPTAVSPGEPEEVPASGKGTKQIIREATGQSKVGEKILTERQALRETLKAQVKAATRAERATREEIFDIQSNMIKVIDESDLELEDKAKFIKTIKNANSPADFERLLPQVEERITVLEQKAEKRDLVGQIKKLAEKSESDSISVEYREAIQDLLKGFDLKGRSKETIRKLEATKAYIDRKLASGEEVEMPADVINRLNILSKKRLDDITNEELKGLLKSIETLEQVGRTKQALKEQAYDKKKMVIKSNLIDDVKAINTKPIPETPIGDTPNKMAERYIKFLNYLSKTRIGLTPIEGLADITGMRKMKDVLDKNFSSYLTFNDKILNDWYELTKDFNQGNFDRIGVYAIAQQEGGIVKLQSSGITQAQIDAVVLTPEEQSAYDFVRSTFDSYYPEIKKYSRDVYNQDVGKVDNYVSFMSDSNAMNELELYDRFSGKTEEAVAKRMTKTVEKGFLESRATGAQYAIDKNIDKIFRRHMDDVAYMLTMGKDVKMYYEVVNSKEMREALGDLGALAWLQYLDLMARKGGSDGAKRIAAIDILRRNMGAGVLGFRLSSALVQLSAFGDAMATMGAEWATRGVTSIATSAEWRNFIMDNFPEVRKAVGDDIAFREFSDDMFGKIQQAGMKPLQFMDGLMRSSATAGAYQKIAQERGVVVDLTKPDKDIILEATKLMRQSQGSSFFKDQPLSITTDFGLADNKSINKMILTFQSFMLGRWDNINRQIWRLGIEKKDYKKAISSLFWLLTFGFALEETLRREGRKVTNLGRNKKDIREEAPFAQDVAFNALQSVPIAGQLASSILYSSNPVPMLNTAESIFGGLGQVVKGKEASTKLKGGIRAIGGLGALSGAPGVSQGAQIISDRIPKKKKITIRD